jgi:hypothetical protein
MFLICHNEVYISNSTSSQQGIPDICIFGRDLCTYIFVELLSVVIYEGEGKSYAQRVKLERVGASLPKPAEHQNLPSPCYW